MHKQSDGAFYCIRCVSRLPFCDNKAKNWSMGKMLVLESLENIPKITFSGLLHFIGKFLLVIFLLRY